MRFSQLFFAEFGTLLCLFFIIFSSLFLKAYVLLFLFFAARRELTTNYVCFYFFSCLSVFAFLYLVYPFHIIIFSFLFFFYLFFFFNLMVWWVFNILSNCFTLVWILFQRVGMSYIFLFFFFCGYWVWLIILLAFLWLKNMVIPNDNECKLLTFT